MANPSLEGRRITLSHCGCASPRDESNLASADIQEEEQLAATYSGLQEQLGDVERRIELLEGAIQSLDASGRVSSDSGCSHCHGHLDDISDTRHPIHASILYSRLANALGHRYELTCLKADLDRQIELYEISIPVLEEERTLDTGSLHASLGLAYDRRHPYPGCSEDIHRAHDHLQVAVNAHPEDACYLTYFALVIEHQQRQQMRDGVDAATIYNLDESYRRAYELSAQDPTSRATCCQYLADALLYGIIYGVKNTAIVHEIISLYEEALSLRPPGHWIRYMIFNGLGVAYHELFCAMGDNAYLNQSILYKTQGAELININHPTAQIVFSNLSLSLSSRYELSGNEADARAAIDYAQRALALCPPSHQRRHIIINVLTSAMMLISGNADTDTLAEIIRLRREGLQICGHDHRDYSLFNLAESLVLRYLRAGDEDDLIEAIGLLREALLLRSIGHPGRDETLSLFGHALMHNYRLRNEVASLDEAIEYLEELERSNPNDYHRSTYLITLGQAHRLRSLHYGYVEDLEKALQHHRTALSLRKPGHVLRHLALSQLAEDLEVRYTQIREPEEIQEAFALRLESILLPIGHPDKAYHLVQIAKLHIILDSPYFNPALAFDYLLKALQDPYRDFQRRVSEVLEVVRVIEEDLVPTWSTKDTLRLPLLDVYQALVDLLPRVASFGLDIRARMRVLSSAKDLAANVASHALALDKPALAMTLLEAGRAVFWAQYLRMRSSFDALPPELAARLSDLSRRLDGGAADRVVTNPDDTHARARADEAILERRKLGDEFERLVKEARTLPGMQNFLAHATYTDLAKAARRGPLVVLLASPSGCWALLTRDPDCNPETIGLDGVTENWLRTASASFRTSLLRSRDIVEARKRGMKMINTQDLLNTEETTLLEELWVKVAKPIIERLGWQMATGRNRPRLFLCPTGAFTFLPLHAAGIYPNSSPRDMHQRCLSDYCVTSYTPTITALNDCINASRPLRRVDVSVLLAAAPEPFMSGSLPSSVDEVKIIRHLLPTSSIIPLPPSADCTLDPSAGVTKEDILSRLPNASIFHVSCHGHQDIHDPLDSGFILRDKMLRLADLMRLQLPHAKLAFLSACETAKGDRNQPDQAVHLAAAMLFAGFPSVVGTMWSMGDVDGPVVAESVYRKLFTSGGEEIDMDVLPYALDAAVHQLRVLGVGPSRWAPYIHVGI